jgi:hypothetical protein
MNALRRLSLTLLAIVLATTSSALACGGGGSGGYRKPARPGQQHQNSPAPATEQGSTAPQNAPQ